MADIVLSNGREITFDMYSVSLTEYREIFDRKQPPEHEDITIAKAAGMSLEEYRALPVPDWRRLVLEFVRIAQRPATHDPNSSGASTST